MRHVKHAKLFAAMLIMVLAGYAYAADMPEGVQARKADSGVTVLVDAKGMTLYTFDKDTTPGKSMCNGRCLMNWPALMATGNAADMGDWTVVTRDDGGKQWAYKGKPLYTFAKDMKPGDTAGDGVGMVWHVAVP